MAELTSEKICDFWTAIQEERPVIHCITNMVTVNDCANILLAAGASPVMAHHPLEAAEVTEGCRALVCNLGATESFDAMLAAAERAVEIGHPVVLDPVGVSGSSYRRSLCFELMNHANPSVIRGNLSEIRALVTGSRTAAGVDAAMEDRIQEGVPENTMQVVRTLAQNRGTIVIASGETDVISDGETVYTVHNGSRMMSRITGSGCMASSLLGAFLSIESSLESAAAACTVMGICGEISRRRTKELRAGTGTYRTELIDAVSLLKRAQIKEMMRVGQIRKK